MIISNTEFTVKEIEIMRLICRQKTAKEISRLIFLSERTVEQYKSNILKRIGARNMAGIIKFSLKYGIIDLEDL
jgi:DNA-binding CsgD family transcriptional regulator